MQVRHRLLCGVAVGIQQIEALTLQNLFEMVIQPLASRDESCANGRWCILQAGIVIAAHQQGVAWDLLFQWSQAQPVFMPVQDSRVPLISYNFAERAVGLGRYRFQSRVPMFRARRAEAPHQVQRCEGIAGGVPSQCGYYPKIMIFEVISC